MTFPSLPQEQRQTAETRTARTIRMNLSILAQDCSEFVGERGKELVHDTLYIGVGQGLLRILEHEAQGILLLSGRDLVPTVNVEQGDLLEELLGDTLRAGLEVSILDIFIKEKGQVTADLRELGKLLESDLVALDKLEQCIPVDLSGPRPD